jgi:hypothetical protein
VTLCEASFKGDALIFLTTEEILRQQSIWAEALILVTAFIQTYNDNWEQKSRLGSFLKFSVWPEKQ